MIFSVIKTQVKNFWKQYLGNPMEAVNNLLVRVDQTFDYIPVLSLASNLVALFIKHVVLPHMDQATISANHYFTHLQSKETWQCVVYGILGVIGKILVEIAQSFQEPAAPFKREPIPPYVRPPSILGEYYRKKSAEDAEPLASAPKSPDELFVEHMQKGTVPLLFPALREHPFWKNGRAVELLKEFYRQENRHLCLADFLEKIGELEKQGKGQVVSTLLEDVAFVQELLQNKNSAYWDPYNQIFRRLTSDTLDQLRKIQNSLPRKVPKVIHPKDLEEALSAERFTDTLADIQDGTILVVNWDMSVFQKAILATPTKMVEAFKWTQNLNHKSLVESRPAPPYREYKEEFQATVWERENVQQALQALSLSDLKSFLESVSTKCPPLPPTLREYLFQAFFECYQRKTKEALEQNFQNVATEMQEFERNRELLVRMDYRIPPLPEVAASQLLWEVLREHPDYFPTFCGQASAEAETRSTLWKICAKLFSSFSKIPNLQPCPKALSMEKQKKNRDALQAFWLQSYSQFKKDDLEKSLTKLRTTPQGPAIMSFLGESPSSDTATTRTPAATSTSSTSAAASRKDAPNKTG